MKELKILDLSGNPVEKLDFGTVPFGQPKKVYLLVHNPYETEFFAISVETDQESVVVEKHPTRLYPNQKGELILTWNAKDSIQKNPVNLSVKANYLE